MMRSNRGAARISAVWMISAIVLFLVAVAFAFIAQSDMAKAVTERNDAIAERDAANENQTEQAQIRRDVSLKLGFVDPSSADPVSDLEAAEQALATLRETFGDLGETDDTFEEVLPKVTASFKQLARKVGELEARVATAESDLQAARNNVTTVSAEKDAIIAGLRQQVADDSQNATQRQQELETRLATQTDQLSERDLELRQARTQALEEKRSLEQEIRRLETRIGELAKATRFSREPFNQFPDGKVVEVSDALSLGWIDIGANQRLTRGTRFRVQSGRTGSERVKALAEVVRVEANRAEVRFVNQADRFDPVVPGDVLINPLYDPAGGRNAVLIGRFSGAYSEQELRVLLERMGINLQPALDLTTHFLIVGSELWNDPETNEPLEEPIQPSELSVFKDAEALGVQIVPLQDIREFFRVDTSTAGN